MKNIESKTLHISTPTEMTLMYNYALPNRIFQRKLWMKIIFHFVEVVKKTSMSQLKPSTEITDRLLLQYSQTVLNLQYMANSDSFPRSPTSSRGNHYDKTSDFAPHNQILKTNPIIISLPIIELISKTLLLNQYCPTFSILYDSWFPTFSTVFHALISALMFTCI